MSRFPTVQPLEPSLAAGRRLVGLGALTIFLTLIFGASIVGIVPGRLALSLPWGAAAVLFLLSWSREKADLLHPVRIFGAQWCFCLSLAALRLVLPISPWGARMWLLMAVALGSFIGGFYCCGLLFRRKAATLPGAQAGGDLSPRELSPAWALGLAVVCLALGIAALSYEYYLTGGIPVLLPQIDEARAKLYGFAGEPGESHLHPLLKVTHQFVPFSKYAVFLAAIALFQKTRKAASQVLVAVLIVLFGLAAYGSQGGRGFVFEIVAVVVALFHYLRRRFSLKEVLIGLAGIFLLLSVAGHLRMVQNPAFLVRGYAGRSEVLPDTDFWNIIAYGYFNLTGPFEVFYRLTRDLPLVPHPSTGFLFYSLHRLVPRANIQALTLDLYTGEMIVPTFLGELYADLGIAGTLVGPWILGMMYQFIYSKGTHSTNVYWMCLRGIFLVYLMLLPYFNVFSYHLLWVEDTVAMAALIGLVGYLAKPVLPRPTTS
jgi:oligosaccharide repeat unit polymerase